MCGASLAQVWVRCTTIYQQIFNNLPCQLTTIYIADSVSFCHCIHLTLWVIYCDRKSNTHSSRRRRSRGIMGEDCMGHFYIRNHWHSYMYNEHFILAIFLTLPNMKSIY